MVQADPVFRSRPATCPRAGVIRESSVNLYHLRPSLKTIFSVEESLQSRRWTFQHSCNCATTTIPIAKTCKDTSKVKLRNTTLASPRRTRRTGLRRRGLPCHSDFNGMLDVANAWKFYLKLNSAFHDPSLFGDHSKIIIPHTAWTSEQFHQSIRPTSGPTAHLLKLHKAVLGKARLIVKVRMFHGEPVLGVGKWHNGHGWTPKRKREWFGNSLSLTRLLYHLPTRM